MHQAFIDFMQNVPTSVEKRVERIINYSVNVMQSDCPTQQDLESVWQQITDLGNDLSLGASDAASDEIKERVIRQYEACGMDPEDAENLFATKWKQMVDVGKQVGKAGRLAWSKILGIGGAAVGAAVLVAIAISSGVKSGNGINDYVNQARTQNDAILRMQVSVNEQEFDEMLQGLDIPDIPHETPLVPLPAPVAAVAATPVTAAVQLSNGTSQTVHTNLGRVYQSVPQARNEIRHEVSYPHRELHGNINVTAPFAAVRIHY